jgi:hypothetical protein
MKDTSDTTGPALNRRQLLETVGTAAAALAAASLAGAAEAQRATADRMPFKATLTNRFQTTPLPLSPAMLSQAVSGTGESELLGEFTVVAHRTVQMGVDGQFLWSDAEGVFTTASGDALFWRTNGLAGQPAAFVVTGGRGRFCGAVGSGAIPRIVVDPATGDATLTWEGTLSIPG